MRLLRPLRSAQRNITGSDHDGLDTDITTNALKHYPASRNIFTSVYTGECQPMVYPEGLRKS